MVTQAVTVSLMFWTTKRPFHSPSAPARFEAAGRDMRGEPGPTGTGARAMPKLLPRQTSFARSATMGWSVDTTAEPWKPSGRPGWYCWKNVQPLPGYIGGPEGGGEAARAARFPRPPLVVRW